MIPETKVKPKTESSTAFSGPGIGHGVRLRYGETFKNNHCPLQTAMKWGIALLQELLAATLCPR